MKISDKLEETKRNAPQILISIDPGSAKTGLAVLSGDKKVLEKKIISTNDIENEIISCINRFKPDIIVIGNATWSKKIKLLVKSVAGNIPLLMVNEKHSTERARLRYFQENPPRGIWKLLPVTMQVPKEPYDDYAAIILAEEYLDRNDGMMEW